MIVSHIQAAADVTIAAVPVHSQAASGLGIMRLDDTGRVVGFFGEAEDRARAGVGSDQTRPGSTLGASRAAAAIVWPIWASICSNAKTLLDVLGKTDYRDFGKEVFPASDSLAPRFRSTCSTTIGKTSVRSSRFSRRTCKLSKPNAPFDLASVEAPIYSHARFLPPTRFDDATIRDSLVADGSMIEPGAVIENSVIGLRARIGRNVRDSQLDRDGGRLL